MYLICQSSFNLCFPIFVQLIKFILLLIIIILQKLKLSNDPLINLLIVKPDFFLYFFFLHSVELALAWTDNVFNYPRN